MKNSKVNDGDLFDNPMTRVASDALSEQDKERYKAIGEEIHQIDYTNSGLNNMPEQMVESIAHLSECVKSGLHPSMLEDNEKEILVEGLGKTWYKKYGYVEADLDEIVTLVIKQ